MFNNFRQLTRKIGGAFHVWHDVLKTKVIGGRLPQSVIKVGTLIPAGTPVEISGGANSEAKLMQVFKVAKAVTATDTEVHLSANHRSPVPAVGEFLMVAPKTIDATGKGAKVAGAIYDEANGVHIITITADALGILKIGDLLVNADKEGATARSSAKPNALTWKDVKIEEGVYEATVSGVTDGIIYEDRITPVPTSVKDILSGIQFEPNI